MSLFAEQHIQLRQDPQQPATSWQPLAGPTPTAMLRSIVQRALLVDIHEALQQDEDSTAAHLDMCFHLNAAMQRLSRILTLRVRMTPLSASPVTNLRVPAPSISISM